MMETKKNAKNIIVFLLVVIIILLGIIFYPSLSNPIKDKYFQEGYNQSIQDTGKYSDGYSQCSQDFLTFIVNGLNSKGYFDLNLGEQTLRLGVVG